MSPTSNMTPQVDLSKCMDALRKASSKRATELDALVLALENFASFPLLEEMSSDLLKLLNNLIRKGKPKEVCLAIQAVGLIGITLNSSLMTAELKEKCYSELSGVLQTWSEPSKMISALNALSVLVCVNSMNFSETESSMKIIWELIQPKKGSKVRIDGRNRPPVLAAAISAWALLLSTGDSMSGPGYLKESVEYLCCLLETDDIRVQIPAAEALALCIELNFVNAFDGHALSEGAHFLKNQSLINRILERAVTLSMDVKGKFSHRKHPNMFQLLVDYIKCDKFPEDLTVGEKVATVIINSWSKWIQLNVLSRFLGGGFLTHIKENKVLQKVFSTQTDLPSDAVISGGSDSLKHLKEEEGPQECVIRKSDLPDGKVTSCEMPKAVCVIYDKRMLDHIPDLEQRPEKPERISSIYKKLQEDGLLHRCKTYESERVNDQHIFAVHDPHYIKLIDDVSKLEGDARLKFDRKYFTDDMYFSQGTSEAALLAAGGVVKACDLIAKGVHDKAFCIVRPPGHHAKMKKASGFCFINNMAVAAKFLLNEHKFKRVLAVDWDVHHGNGSQEIFYEDNTVLFVSLHRHERGFYPYDKGGPRSIGKDSGVGFNVNFCWKHDSIRDDDFLVVTDHLLLPIARDFQPDIVLISCGFDAGVGDSMGDCSVTPQGFATVLKKILDATNGKIALILEGGYDNDCLGQSAAACVKVLTGDMSEVRDHAVTYVPYITTLETIVSMRKRLGTYWPVLTEDLPSGFMDTCRPAPSSKKSSK